VLKNLLSLILIVFMLINMFQMGAVAENNITVKLNGTALKFDVPPQIIDGKTLVPMRAIFKVLGADVEWDNDTQKISAVCGICKSNGITHNIMMTIGDPYMYTYRAEVKPNEPPTPGMAIARDWQQFTLMASGVI
jgi:hypothetical protein